MLNKQQLRQIDMLLSFFNLFNFGLTFLRKLAYSPQPSQKSAWFWHPCIEEAYGFVVETDPYHKTSAKILDIYVYKLDNRDRKCPNVGSATDCSVRNDSLFRNWKAAIKFILSILICFSIC